MSAAEGASLAGVRVLVTRPAHQADGLSALIERAGGIAVRFPTIEIAPPTDAKALEQIVDRLDQFDLAIFVSPNAVANALPVVQTRRRQWPTRVSVACIGSGTARTLATFGVRDVIVPARADSEGLLALPAFIALTGRRMVIFRGEGGRELLAQTLSERGAVVEHGVCYRRVLPTRDAGELARALAQRAVDVVTVTSVDALHNLHAMLDIAGREALMHLPIVTVSERVREAGRMLGLRGPLLVADSPADESIVAAVRAWRGTLKNL